MHSKSCPHDCQMCNKINTLGGSKITPIVVQCCICNNYAKYLRPGSCWCPVCSWTKYEYGDQSWYRCVYNAVLTYICKYNKSYFTEFEVTQVNFE